MKSRAEFPIICYDVLIQQETNWRVRPNFSPDDTAYPQLTPQAWATWSSVRDIRHSILEWF